MTALFGPGNDYSALMNLEAQPELPTVSVIVPVYNRVELLQRTLAAMTHQTYEGTWDIVIVDDGSEEDVSAAVGQIARESSVQISIVHQSHDGYGAGRARNLGAKTAEGSVLIFVDADCMPHPDLIKRHIEWHRRATNVVVIGSRQHVDTTESDSNSILSGGIPSSLVPDEKRDFREIFYRRTTKLRFGDEAFRALVSSNFSVRRDLFELVGGFDETFKRWGGEDTELGWRLFESGAYIIPEDTAIIFHQVQIDGDEGWRESGRIENNDQIASLIPHRFYRKSFDGPTKVRPKITWVISPIVDKQIPRLALMLSRQNVTDFETIWVGDTDKLARSTRKQISRVRGSTSPTLKAALESARGQYVATIHGWAIPDHRLAGRLMRRFDSRPRLGLATSGYQVSEHGRIRKYTREQDAPTIADPWISEGLPPFTWARRREWSKGLLAGTDPAEAFTHISGWAEKVHLPDALVALPGREPTLKLSTHYSAFQSVRRKLIDDVSTQPLQTVPAVHRFLRSYLIKPHAETCITNTSSSDELTATRIRYIGWTGNENFGDEVMLESVTKVMNWGEIHTKGEASNLLLLGGGTLINRGGYLKWLQSKDSPRIERAVFGTGVANPSYWGETEPKEQWVDFLSTCAYVGVRGPLSAEILTDWGVTSPIEVVGDSALLLHRPSGAKPTDHNIVTISPARTKDQLWGQSDETVFAALANLTRRLIDQGRDVRFLSCFPADDRPIFEIMRAAGRPDLPYVAAYARPEAGVALLAESGVVVSERLHGAVVAAACGTPFVGLEYRPKIRDFAESVDMEQYVLPTNDLGGLHELFEQLERDIDTATLTMNAAVAGYRERLKAASKTIQKAVG